MPISQTRMMAVIAAGLDYQQALERLIAKIKQEVHNVKYKVIPPEAAIQLLELYASELDLLERGRDSPTTLALEHRHFESRSKINSREAERAARRRAERVDKSKKRVQKLGDAKAFINSVQPKHKAPETLVPKNFMAEGRDKIEAEAEAIVELTPAEAAVKAKIEAETKAEAEIEFKIPGEESDGDSPERQAATLEEIERLEAEKAKRDEWLANNKHQCDALPGRRCTMCGKMRPPEAKPEAKD